MKDMRLENLDMLLWRGACRVEAAARALVKRAPWLPLALITLAWGVWLLLPDDAFGRPGGGHSFGGRRSSGGGYRSSGYRSSGSHGSGDISGLIYLISFLIRHPAIGIPVLICCIAFYFYSRSQQGSGWTTTTTTFSTQGGLYTPSELRNAIRQPVIGLRKRLEALRMSDPDFSVSLFEDFLYALYARAQEARGSKKLAELAGYLAPEARAVLERNGTGIAAVTTVVIGAMRYQRVSGTELGTTQVSVRVEFEANYTELKPDGRGGHREQAWYVTEVWDLSRSPSARSKPPEQIKAFGCPSCGASLQAQKGNTCTYCGNVIDTGEFDWRVDGISLVHRESRGPQLTGDVAEEGTSLPTVVDSQAAPRLKALLARDPALSWGDLENRITLIFTRLQTAWSSLNWLEARPYVSDNLFQMQLYWIEAYKRAGLRNITENARVTGMDLASVSSDRYYDAITVRIRAESLDYTITADGSKVVSGSRTKVRRYTEYWTLIRGSAAKGAPRLDQSCPSCGAALKVNMAGHCEYCRSRVSSGDFDWVLSRIEQDETYQG